MTDIKMTAFEIISYAGDAKSSAYEALEAAKQNDHAGYEAKMEEAENKINEAHKAQYAMLQQEAADQLHAEFSIIVVHAQDHLMTTMCEINNIKRLIELYDLIVNQNEVKREG